MTKKIQIKAFFQQYFSGCQQGYINIWTRQDKQSRSFRIDELEAAATCADELCLGGKDVYFRVLPMKRAFTGNQRGKKEDVEALVALWADIDLSVGNHASGRNYPPTKEDVSRLICDLPKPSMLVHSGGGLHAYWLLESPMQINNDDDRKHAEFLSVGFQRLIKKKMEQEGYSMDSTADLSRILRVPCTKNFKDVENPKDVTIIDWCEHPIRYSIKNLDQLVADNQPTPSLVVREDRISDGEAEALLRRCSFIKYCESQSENLSEPMWYAMVTNLACLQSGDELIHRLSKPYSQYSHEETKRKIEHARKTGNPHTCQYIKEQLGFNGCPMSCRAIAPVGWSTSTVLKNIDKIEQFLVLPDLTKDLFIQQNIVESLAELRVKDEEAYDSIIFKFHDKIPGMGKRCLENLVNRRVQSIHIRRAKIDTQIMLSKIAAHIGYEPIIPKGYAITQHGIERIGGNSKEIVVAQCVLPIKQYISTEKQLVEIAFELQENQWKHCIVERRMLANSSEVVSLANSGLLVDSTKSSKLVQYFTAYQRDNRELPKVHCTSHLGWQADRSFLPGCSTMRLVRSGDIIDSTNELIPMGDLQEWIKMVLPLRAFQGARLVLAAAFAAPLLDIVGVRTFLIHIWGPSQGGKTAAQKAAASVWLNPESAMFSFNSTKVGTERQLGYLKNLPVLIDERQVAGDNQDYLDSLIYMIAEGQGRTRGTRHGGIQTAQMWRTIIITSGEHPLSGNSSAEGVKTRTLELYSPKVIGDSELASGIHTRTSELYGLAGPAVLMAINDRHEEIRRRYQEMREKVRANCNDLSGSYCDYFAILAVTEGIVGELLFGMNTETANQAAQEMIEIIKNGIATNQNNQEHVRAKQYLEDWVAQHMSTFMEESEAEVWTPSKCSGWIHEDTVYFFSNVFREVLSQGGFNEQRVKRDFSRLGWLHTQRDQSAISYTITRKRPDSNVIVRVVGLPNLLRRNERIEAIGAELRLNQPDEIVESEGYIN